MKPEEIQEIFQRIRQKQPVIHMIPNNVSVALGADGLSALGARPLMAVAAQEMEEIVAQADGVVVNLGQPTMEKREAAKLALMKAAKDNKPVVLDPVGCGASTFRLELIQELLKIPWKGIIKGNQSEVYSIQQNVLTREGIDARKERELAEIGKTERIFLVSGKVDRILWSGGTHKLQRKETRRRNMVGSGCLFGAVVGACYSVEENPVQASIAAAFGMRYALAQADTAEGYGTAKTVLLDAMEQLSGKEFLDWMKGIDE